MKPTLRIFSELNWIFFVSRRFSRVDRKSRSLVTGVLSSLGIGFGVMTLIVTLSVMNGFQRTYIDSIMEISSSHIRYTMGADTKNAAEFESLCAAELGVIAVTPFYEAQTLMTSGERGVTNQQAALIRAVPANMYDVDMGFRQEVRIAKGEFDLSTPNSIVLGSGLSLALGVTIGDTVNLFALSGGSDVDLLSAERLFTVSGIFRSGYSDINAAYAFISLEAGTRYLGASAERLYSIKLKNPDHAEQVLSRLKQKTAYLSANSDWDTWRHLNRSFFGALRVEKNILMMLVFIIFVVVGVNIFNGMRRMVFERRAEIAVFSAVGGRNSAIQTIFITRGFLTGIAGAGVGLALGLLICVRMDSVFMLVSSLQYHVSYFFWMLINPDYADLIQENSMYMVYAAIPARIYPPEVLVTTIFGIFSALAAAWSASRGVLKTSIAEVLRDE